MQEESGVIRLRIDGKPASVGPNTQYQIPVQQQTPQRPIGIQIDHCSKGTNSPPPLIFLLTLNASPKGSAPAPGSLATRPSLWLQHRDVRNQKTQRLMGMYGLNRGNACYPLLLRRNATVLLKTASCAGYLAPPRIRPMGVTRQDSHYQTPPMIQRKKYLSTPSSHLPLPSPKPHPHLLTSPLQPP